MTTCVLWAQAEKGLEKGQRIRLDSTAVESDISIYPTRQFSALRRRAHGEPAGWGSSRSDRSELQAEGQAGGAVALY